LATYTDWCVVAIVKVHYSYW